VLPGKEVEAVEGRRNPETIAARFSIHSLTQEEGIFIGLEARMKNE
jgi:hypothetical protein